MLVLESWAKRVSKPLGPLTFQLVNSSFLSLSYLCMEGKLTGGIPCWFFTAFIRTFSSWWPSSSLDTILLIQVNLCMKRSSTSCTISQWLHGPLFGTLCLTLSLKRTEKKTNLWACCTHTSTEMRSCFWGIPTFTNQGWIMKVLTDIKCSSGSCMLFSMLSSLT